MRRLRRYLRIRYVRYAGRTIYLAPLLVGLFSGVLLALPAQLREIYLSIVETRDFAHGVLGLACIMFLSSLLYVWAVRLSTWSINELYPSHADIFFDHGLFRLRNGKALVCAALPAVGLGLGLLSLYFEGSAASDRLKSAWDALGHPESAVDLNTLPSEVRITLAVTCAFYAVFLLFIRRRIDSVWVQDLLIGVAGLLVLTTVAAPLLLPSAITVTAVRMVGPLAGLALVLVTITSVLMFLSWLSRKLRFPIIGLIITISLLAVGKQMLNELVPRGGQTVASQSGATPEQASEAPGQFDEWLKTRMANGDGQAFKRYPVFIISAQGGGIYAASASAAFLSALQDQCSNFAQHVFAISGVSGGSVGTAIFDGLIAQRGLEQSPCSAGKNADFEAVKQIITNDHISPVFAFIIPDFLCWLSREQCSVDRATILEESFTASFNTATKIEKGGGPLKTTFKKHWPTNDAERLTMAGPALILNTTWVENGYRVAFAPFKLQEIGDDTLFSFGDFGADHVNSDKTLIGAAIISARFPVIAPSWQLPSRTWNFVDGGYVDGSGATTALELYNALKRHLKDTNREDQVDLRLIIMSNAPGSQFGQISGDTLSETFAPIYALLNVRSQLAARAVTRARKEAEGNVFLVQLEQSVFPLPLGWMISKRSNDLVNFMIGRDLLSRTKQEDQDQLCAMSLTTAQQIKGAPQAATPSETESALLQSQRVADTVRTNSCVMVRVRRLLSGPQPD